MYICNIKIFKYDVMIQEPVMKFKVDSIEMAKLIQSKLYDMGYRWEDNGSRTIYKNLNCTHLFTHTFPYKKITYTIDKSDTYFDNHNGDEFKLLYQKQSDFLKRVIKKNPTLEPKLNTIIKTSMYNCDDANLLNRLIEKYG